MENDMIVKIVNYSQLVFLTEEEKLNLSGNGCGRKDAAYLVVTHKGNVLRIESDAMEPEDACFSRDLSWVADAILESFSLGYEEGLKNLR